MPSISFLSSPFYCLLLVIAAVSQLFSKAYASQAAGTETLVGIVGKDFILLGADSSVSQSISLTASNLDKIAPLSEPFLLYDDDDDNDPKRRVVSSPFRQQTIVAAAAGDAADSDRLVGMLQAHATIQEYQSGVGCDVDYYLPATNDKNDNDGHALFFDASSGLDVEAMANLARGQIASSLRSRAPLRVCLLIAGMMPTTRGKDYHGEGFFVSKQVQEQVRRASGMTKFVDMQISGEEENLSIREPRLEPRLYWLDEYGSMQKIQYGAHGYGSNFCLSILDQGFRPDMSQEEAIKLLRDCFQQLRTRYIINSPQPPCIKCVDSKGVRLIP